MAATQCEARIIARRQLDGKVRLGVYDPITAKETQTGLVAGPDQDAIDREVYKLKRTLERAGNRVTFREIGLS